MELPAETGEQTSALLARLRTFCFPGGEEPARGVRAVRTTQSGEFRMSPGARWLPFTAEERTEATESAFCWTARIGTGITAIGVTDAYEHGHGRLVVKAGGILPVKMITGPESDKGELQRYLASIITCPPMLLNNAALEWTLAGPNILRVRDRKDPTGATVHLEVGDDGCPLSCRAERPRTVGKQVLLTPWLAMGTEFRESEGLEVPKRLEAVWRLPEGEFSYFRSEVTSFTVLR